MAPRILLCGDPLGRLNQLFKRVQSVSKSAGPFDALICVGQFFPDSPELLDEFLDYVEGRAQVPIPTYFTGDYGVAAPKILSTTSKKAENQGFKMDGLEVSHSIGGMMSQSGKRMDLKGKSSVSNLSAQVPVLVGKLAISNTMLKQKNSAVEVFVLILSSMVSVKKAQSAATSRDEFQDEEKAYKGSPDPNILTGLKNAGFVYQARV